jgi:hypothetical protein
MPRTARVIQAGWIYHVLNRGNGRMRLFHKPEDYAEFERVLAEGLERRMRCQQCGREIRSGEKPLFTTTEHQVGPASVAGAETRMFPLALCSICARRRNKTYRYFIWMFALIVIALTVIGLLSNL